jgi:heat shock protein HslJ
MKLKHSVARWWVMAGVILLGACAQPPVNLSITVPVTPTVMAGTEWIAFSIDGVDEVLAPKPQLRWVQPERVTGTGGCNAFRGLAVSEDGSLRLGPLAPTGAACLSLPSSQEDLFFKALEQTRNAYLVQDQLVLMDQSGKVVARLLKTK